MEYNLFVETRAGEMEQEEEKGTHYILLSILLFIQFVHFCLLEGMYQLQRQGSHSGRSMLQKSSSFL